MAQPLNSAQKKLVDDSIDFLKLNYKQYRHHVACMLECGQGIYPALHLDTKGFDICAEPIAISNALAAGEAEFRTIVAVGRSVDGGYDVVNPCGNCSQMLLQYAPEIEVIVTGTNGLEIVPATSLMPWPYS